MAKQVRLRPAEAKLRGASARPRARVRPAEPAAPAAAVVARPTVSDPVRLAAEVARLEAELATMRTRLAELESHAESDPLTAVMNRRGPSSPRRAPSRSSRPRPRRAPTATPIR